MKRKHKKLGLRILGGVLFFGGLGLLGHVILNGAVPGPILSGVIGLFTFGGLALAWEDAADRVVETFEPLTDSE